ncbi:MAG: hypothetical protein HY075_07230 [Deltaproteobacteria bacterium]|nr:hypothetical protein [Deltaproteobacteria bacterium]
MAMLVAITLAPNARAGAEPCLNCSALQVPEVFQLALMYVKAGCSLFATKKNLKGESFLCHQLMLRIEIANCSPTKLDSDLNEIREWLAFKNRFVSPCQPIPSKYLDSRSIFFNDTIKLLAPVVVSHPDEAYPPVSLAEVVETVRATATRQQEKGRKFIFDFQPLLKREMAKPGARELCDKAAGGKCCGPTRSPLYFDAGKPAPNGRVSIGFVTVHSYGTYENTPAGNHVFDSESAQFKYEPVGPGMVRLSSVAFSRHGLATEELPACNGAAYLFHRDGGSVSDPKSSIRSRRDTGQVGPRGR